MGSEHSEEEDKIKNLANCNIYLNYNGEYSEYHFIYPEARVKDLKQEHINHLFDVRIEEQRLFYKDKELKNDELLKNYINKKLDVYLGIEKGILIKMRRISGEILNLSLPQKIELAKEKIGEITRLPIEEMILTTDEGEELDNSKYFNDYNIYNKETINVFFKSQNGIILFVQRGYERSILALDVNKSETISNLKKKIAKKNFIRLKIYY